MTKRASLEWWEPPVLNDLKGGIPEKTLFYAFSACGVIMLLIFACLLGRSETTWVECFIVPLFIPLIPIVSAFVFFLVKNFFPRFTFPQFTYPQFTFPRFTFPWIPLA
jgi:hypothetical protein